MVQYIHLYVTTGKTIALVCLLKSTTWELRVKFYLGQNEDSASEAASQIALRDCSKAAAGESQ